MNTKTFLENEPGRTEFQEYKKPTTDALCTTHQNDRRAILLATQLVTDANLFSNGLFQNILILYDMFESLGFTSYLLVNKKPEKDEISQVLSRYKLIVCEEILRNPMPIHCYIEIGMSVGSSFRLYLRNMGAKIIKLYLGNILNIDIESVNCIPGIFFPHHIIGDLDEIWTSPHYGQNLEYGTALNRVPLEKGRIAPYVWEPCFFTQFGSRNLRWKQPESWTETPIVIMEPNISFQKSFILPLLLVDAYSEQTPEWKGKLIVMNANRLKNNIHVMKSVMPGINLENRGRIVYKDRHTIAEVLEEYPSALFVGHQYNNDFNYMTFELMYAGVPLLHTSEAWSEFGYHWHHTKWSESIATLSRAVRYHADNLQAYSSHAMQLYWHHSIHNPSNKMAWNTLINLP
jgi:Protein of unknown function (DUF2827)